MANPICWWELASHNADKSVEFLRTVFGWEAQLDQATSIYDVPTEGLPGGVFTLRKAKLPFLTLYIEVDDIDAKARQVEQQGGFIVIPPFALASGSRICLFNEPSGVTFAMLQRAKKDPEPA